MRARIHTILSDYVQKYDQYEEAMTGLFYGLNVANSIKDDVFVLNKLHELDGDEDAVISLLRQRNLSTTSLAEKLSNHDTFIPPSSIFEEENDVERRENSDALGQLGVREHPPLHMYLFASVCLTAVTFAIFQLFFPTQGREEL